LTRALAVRTPTGGFTLLEVMLVVFLITIVTAAVLPSFKNVLSPDISDDAKQVVSIVRMFLDVSGSTGTMLPMVINLDGKTIHYIDEDKEAVRRIGSLYSVETASSGLKVNGEVDVKFQPSGFSEYLRVRLFDGDEYLDVVYNPYSGRVLVKDVPPEEREREDRERGR